MTALFFYDDARARTFAPFIATRPVSELRAGAELLRRRWERVAACPTAAFISAPHLVDFDEADAAHAAAPDQVMPAGSIVVNSRCAVDLDEVLATGDSLWACDGVVCAVRLVADVPVARLLDGTEPLDALLHSGAGTAPRALHGRWVADVWDFIAQLTPQLTADITALARTVHSASTMYDAMGSHPLAVEAGAIIEPYVLFDVTAGPILVRQGATISAFTRIVGPCYIGEHATIVGDRIANCAIGEMSKIRGEISSSIVLGHSNKGHTGFVGHSYLGRWVNLGAGTTTSNLKNTYGTVQMWTPDGVRDTGLQFLGTMFGDHAKTGIGTMLTTGSVLGAGANVYGSAGHPRYVEPFSWGERAPYGVFSADKFLTVAERVMRRRNVALSDRQRQHLARVHDVHTRAAR